MEQHCLFSGGSLLIILCNILLLHQLFWTIKKITKLCLIKEKKCKMNQCHQQCKTAAGSFVVVVVVTISSIIVLLLCWLRLFQSASKIHSPFSLRLRPDPVKIAFETELWKRGLETKKERRKKYFTTTYLDFSSIVILIDYFFSWQLFTSILYTCTQISVLFYSFLLNVTAFFCSFT